MKRLSGADCIYLVGISPGLWPIDSKFSAAECMMSAADVIGARKSRINLGSSKFTGGRWLALFAVLLMTATSLTVPSRVDGAYGAAVFLIACRAAYLFLWCDPGKSRYHPLRSLWPSFDPDPCVGLTTRWRSCMASWHGAVITAFAECACERLAGSGWPGSSSSASRFSPCSCGCCQTSRLHAGPAVRSPAHAQALLGSPRAWQGLWSLSCQLKPVILSIFN
jgi:hypothetical protein